MKRADLDKACRVETERAMALHDDARDYVAGEVEPHSFLDAAHRYGLARLHRERLQDELWGPEP